MAKRFIQKIEGTDGTARVYFDPAFEEYVVKVEDDEDGAQDYFTDDKQDAIATAQVMVSTVVDAGPGKEFNFDPATRFPN